MAGLFDHLADRRAERHAQRWLAGLMDQVGAAGLAAAAHRADWLTVRVLAVCALSRSDDWRRPSTPLHPAPDPA